MSGLNYLANALLIDSVNKVIIMRLFINCKSSQVLKLILVQYAKNFLRYRKN